MRDSALALRCAHDLVERARPIGASDRILDLGCGTGIVARILRERLGGAASIVGVDASPAMVEKARSIAPELDWREGHAAALPFAEESFDLVLCQEMLPFVPDRVAALREVRRVLSPGGRLLVSASRLRGEEPFGAGAFTEAGFEKIQMVADVVTATKSRKAADALRNQTHGGNHDVRDR